MSNNLFPSKVEAQGTTADMLRDNSFRADGFNLEKQLSTDDLLSQLDKSDGTFDSVWNTDDTGKEKLLDNVLHVCFPWKNEMICTIEKCSFIAKGKSWSWTVSSLSEHLSQFHNIHLMAEKKWCKMCKKEVQSETIIA